MIAGTSADHIGQSRPQVITPPGQSWRIPELHVMAHVPLTQRTVQPPEPEHVAVHPPLQVTSQPAEPEHMTCEFGPRLNVQAPEPGHVAVQWAPHALVHPSEPEHDTWQLSPHVDVQRSLPGHVQAVAVHMQLPPSQAGGPPGLVVLEPSLAVLAPLPQHVSTIRRTLKHRGANLESSIGSLPGTECFTAAAWMLAIVAGAACRATLYSRWVGRTALQSPQPETRTAREDLAF